MRNLTIAVFTVAAVLGAAAVNGKASATPLNGLPLAATQSAVSVEKVAWICGAYRCWWRPGPYWGGPYGRPHYGYWGGPRWGWRGWGWHRHWG